MPVEVTMLLKDIYEMLATVGFVAAGFTVLGLLYVSFSGR